MLKKLNLIILIIVLIFMCIGITGCKESKKEMSDSLVNIPWENIFDNNTASSITNDKLEIFENAKKNYSGIKLEPIALLGEQLVSGKNYMFLAKGYSIKEKDEAKYKMVVVYNDLNNQSNIISVEDFDYTKYVNKTIRNRNAILAGGWFVDIPNHINRLEGKIQSTFEKSISRISEIKFMPMAVLGQQKDLDINYAVICYGRSTFDNTADSIYVLTVYEDYEGNQSIISEAYVDLSEYSK